METLLADLRYALRTMRRNLGFTAIALAALALGIGANTAIFTVVDGVLLQPLPYPQPDRIMKLGRQFRTGVGYSISIPKYMAWRQNDVFDAMALYDFGALAMNVGSGNPPQTVKGLHVSGDYFKVFGVSPVAVAPSRKARICRTARPWPSSVMACRNLASAAPTRCSGGQSC